MPFNILESIFLFILFGAKRFTSPHPLNSENLSSRKVNLFPYYKFWLVILGDLKKNNGMTVASFILLIFVQDRHFKYCQDVTSAIPILIYLLLIIEGFILYSLTS